MDVRPMREELQRLIWSYPRFDVVTLTLVPSVRDWKVKRGIPEDDAFVQASLVCLHDETYWIAMLEEITAEHPARTPLVINVGLEDYQWISSDLRRYARHLVLHEIAHGILETKDEAKADQWTVPELRKLEGAREV